MMIAFGKEQGIQTMNAFGALVKSLLAPYCRCPSC